MTAATEILDELKALSAHYPRRQMAQADFVRWLDDYVSDLTSAGFDGSDVRIACSNWRTSEAKKMPTPGELLAYCRKVFRTDKVVAKIEPLPPRARPTADERERVRQGLRALAQQLRGVGRVDFSRLALRPGESPAEQGMRLWPKHCVNSQSREYLDEAI